MKKIGILTFHRPINFGAALQAVATYKYLHSMGKFDVEMIDYRHARIEKERRVIGGRIGIQMTGLQNLKSLVKDFIDCPKERKRRKLFDKFLKENLRLSKKTSDRNIDQISSTYDILLVGSDLVWNWELDKNLNPVFFLRCKCKSSAVKVAYASSIGCGSIPTELKNTYRDWVCDINYVSVREVSASKLLSQLTNRVIPCVVDPTLLLGSGTWRKMEKEVKTPDRFIFVYALENTTGINEIIFNAASILQIPIVYYARKKRNYNGATAKRIYEIGPCEFLYLIEHAELVITNSFHGTSFSTLLQTPFISIPHSTRGSRMVDFLNGIGEGFRCCRNWTEVNFEKCKKKVNADAQVKLSDWVEYSKRYLESAIIK